MMKSFNHIDANSVVEATRLLEEHEGKARLFAGGTDLLGVLKDKILPEYPETLINIKTIPNMAYIQEESGILKIGALTKLSNLVNSSLVMDKYKILHQAAYSVGSPQLRHMGTIGGNLCQDVRCWYYRYPHQIGGRILCRRKGGDSCKAVKGDNRYLAIMKGKKCFAVCPSDIAVALSALEARIQITGPNGERTIPSDELYKPLGNDLAVGEMITEIMIPQPPAKVRQTFLKFRMRNAIDFAIVSVGSVINVNNDLCTDARISLGALAAAPIRATKAEQNIQGKRIDAALADTASDNAVSGAKALSRNAYKIQVTKTLVKRALLA